MARREFEPKLGELALMAKDLGLATRLAGADAASLPIVAAATALYERAGRSGLAAADRSTLISLLEPVQSRIRSQAPERHRR
jgi:3-hydroxyisobutyrate dehydrogenase-like beta-hydroxyacid dehydrogenase